MLQVLADDDMTMMIMIMAKEEDITPSIGRSSQMARSKLLQVVAVVVVDHSLVMVMILIL